MLPEEEWRSVPSFPELMASSHGRIFRKPHTAMMPNGGLRVFTSDPTFGVIAPSCDDGRSLRFTYQYRGIGTVKVHVLVCEAFHGVKPPKFHGVRHKNENGLDNRPSNLEWATQAKNLNDRRVKRYHHERLSPHLSVGSKSSKRSGIYDNIIDVGVYVRELRQGRYQPDV